ncbi:CBO0543 family protein [Halalkalibacter nanhaiisediminis]|uniref:Uncharacterized protein n=1 Tax=Halalkalibacter nanhaiisediminis TaxID=688079 RepID=A0A562QGJ0_9BACI|nr:CBO0543 family protein [Halalkalibacter nanhaiisediminis]TWI55872.1 hypothetical protein IQ10_02432 [Halalkalibacter nanhaiisediminis]
MNVTQQIQIEHIKATQLELTNLWYNYWQQFSDLSTWPFWVNLGFFVIPLIALYIVIDRRKAFLLGFFGFNVHVWFTYIDALGVSMDWWFYPYKILPVLPVSFALDASFVPVVYMLIYQWTINHNKNYYLYTLGLCLFLAFVFKPILTAFNLFTLNGDMSYIHLFLAYVTIAIISKIITNIFISLKKQDK